MTKRLQNKIAESRLSLPVTAALALLAWLSGGVTDGVSYINLTLLGVSTYLMVELNNRNSLIRTYSRMVACSFLALTTMTAMPLAGYDTLAIQLCVIAMYTTLFSCYQDKRSTGRVFYAFLFVGLASLLFPPIIILTPILWILIATNLMAFNGRAVWASLIGVATPYWFIGGYYLFKGDAEVIVNRLTSIQTPDILTGYDALSEHQIVTMAFIVIISLTGTIHFLRNSYKDKIRTRMLYEMIIAMNALTIALVILMPRHADQLSAIMIVHASILIAHFITLTRTWVTNVAFYIITILTVAITIYNIWTPSLTLL